MAGGGIRLVGADDAVFHFVPVVFLEGEHSVFDGPMNRERSANAKKLGGKTMSGFGYRIPVGLLGGDLTGRLRVYVLEGELATELEYGPKGAWLRRE